MLARMAEIVHFMQNRAYQRANDSYLRLSIGNAPWPIGVTMVGYVHCNTYEMFKPSMLILISAVFTNVLLVKRSPQIKWPMF
jgi:hypothetical protein